MADDRVFIPQSSGGIVRYSDELHSGIKIGPVAVVVFIVVVIVLELILHQLL